MARDSFGKKVDKDDKDSNLAPSVIEGRHGISQKEKLESDGFDGNDIPEVRINYRSLKTEKIIRGKYNCHIVLGRDRIGNLTANTQAREEDPYAMKTGYGGNGFKNCSSIDIVAGVGGVDPDYVDGSKTKLVQIGPDFKKDAARIYISQTTDLDRDFEIGSLSKGFKSESLPAVGASGIGIKADHVRIIARKEMKLITGGDYVDSNDKRIVVVGGIALMGPGKEEDLQPLVKGGNLVLALKQVIAYMDSLSGVVEKINKNIRDLGQDLMLHSHNSPFFGAPTGPPSNGVGFKASSEALNVTMQDLIGFKRALPNFNMDFLSEASGRYINSRSNTTT